MRRFYEHSEHPLTALRRATGPVKVADQHPAGSSIARFNRALALRITAVVGSMWCAYAFALFDLISLPTAIRTGTAAIVSWIAQTFLQLVLLSVIMVGQNVQAEAADKRSIATYYDTEAILHGQAQIAGHLHVQDELLRRLAEHAGVSVEELGS